MAQRHRDLAVDWRVSDTVFSTPGPEKHDSLCTTSTRPAAIPDSPMIRVLHFLTLLFVLTWLSTRADSCPVVDESERTPRVSSHPSFLDDQVSDFTSVTWRARYLQSEADEVDTAHDARPSKPDTIETFASRPLREQQAPSPFDFASDDWCAELASPLETGDSTSAPSVTPLVRTRRGCHQGSQVNLGWISDDSDSGLMQTTFDTSTTFAIPLWSFENLLVITPYFRADLLDSAVALDLPDTVFETGVKALWKRPVSDRWSSLLIVTPSVRSDFTTGDGAFRLFGLGLLTWQWVPEHVTVSGGVVYTGRDDYPVLPAAGLLWTPSPDWKLDLQFPSPRLSRCLSRDDGLSETWLYLAGVFGGNTWAVTRPSGPTDELTLRDLRLVGGIEHLMTENCGAFVELGVVFNRSIEYASSPIEQELDSTWIARFGVSF